MSRKVCITAVDGHTGFTIAELLLQHTLPQSKNVEMVVGLALDTDAERAQEFQALGGLLVPHVPGRLRDIVKTLRDSGCDTLCLVPPPHEDKFDITAELVHAAEKVGVANVLLISSAGCDYADPKRHPRLREFIELEGMVLQQKGDTSSGSLAHSPCVIRAGFYAENLLLYAPQAQSDATLPLPVGEKHKFAPVALGDVAQVAVHVLSGVGKQGFDDRHRGQLMVVTGPQLCAGNELATAASQALGTTIQFENISASEAKKVLRAQSESDQSEQQYILEYYSLVREGKTNYVSTTAFRDVTGSAPTEPTEFFKMYAGEMRPRKKQKTRH
ncbi:hypothetical protein C8R45DRAFT_153294 [Mycena sanguinolenta]|nr:hypothetical protein C8R45DRAFT_153294 [Mycena sanguinolenta]